MKGSTSDSSLVDNTYKIDYILYSHSCFQNGGDKTLIPC
jgi:hypothetical protein